MPPKGDIRNMVDQIPMFDTHQHAAGYDWGIPPDDKAGRSLPQIIFNDYLLYLQGAARHKGPSLISSAFPIEKAEEHWAAGRELLENLRPLTTYRALRIGFKDLYGFEGDDITDDNWKELNDKVVRTYQTHGERRWLAKTLKRANVSRIVQFCNLPYVVDHWNELNDEDRNLEKSFIRPSLFADVYACIGENDDKRKARARTFEIIGLQPASFTEYREAIQKSVARFREAGGVGIKFLAAYFRDIFFDQVPEEEARAIYERGPDNATPSEHRRLEDHLVWHLVRCASESGLAVSFHTAYSTPASRGDPSQLLNLISAFSNVPFDLCHAAWPYAGEHAIMARSFANVYFNFAWTPLLSASLAKRQLSEMLEIIPANKMLLGLDTGTAESCYGAALLTRRMLAEVLAEKVADGAFAFHDAEVVAHRLLRDNAEEVFGSAEAPVGSLLGSARPEEQPTVPPIPQDSMEFREDGQRLLQYCAKTTRRRFGTWRGKK